MTDNEPCGISTYYSISAMNMILNVNVLNEMGPESVSLTRSLIL